MERTELNEKVNQLVADQLGVRLEEVSADKTLSDLGADSLDVVELVMAAEDEFDIEISDETLSEHDEQNMTVEKFADLIQQQIG